MNKIDTLEPDFAELITKLLERVSEATGLHWIIVSTTRTMREQELLYSQGRGGDTRPRVTNAPPGSSAHNFGLGCDCAPLAKGNDHEIWWNAPGGYWEAYGALAESMGLTWGGNFKSIVDKPHVEHPRWREQRNLWEQGKVLLK